MSTRFPTPQNLTEEQRSVIEEAVRVINTTYDGKVQIRDSAGNLLGPFAALIYTPRTFLLYLNHITTAVTTSLLTPRERELATLVTASVTKSEFVVYAHRKIALTLGITEGQADDAVDGDIPDGLGEREILVTQLALKFARTFGTVRDETWAKGEQVLGKEGLSALAQYVASYLHASTLVNAANIAVPDS